MRSTSQDISCTCKFWLIKPVERKECTGHSDSWRNTHATLIPETWRACMVMVYACISCTLVHATAHYWTCVLLGTLVTELHIWHLKHFKCGLNAWSPNLNKDLHATQCNRMQNKMHDYARGNSYETNDLNAGRSQSWCRANFSGEEHMRSVLAGVSSQEASETQFKPTYAHNGLRYPLKGWST